jgi:glycogen operon protein
MYRVPASWQKVDGYFGETVRALWTGRPPGLGELVARFGGATIELERDYAIDLVGGASATINRVDAVATHEGRTLRDRVSYAPNELGRLRSGILDDTSSSNFGVEGPTEDSDVLRRRGAAVRCMLATLFLSSGVPMLGHGDELGRTQLGSDDVEYQDDERSWIDWPSADQELIGFVRRLIAFRKAHPLLRRRVLRPFLDERTSQTEPGHDPGGLAVPDSAVIWRTGVRVRYSTSESVTCFGLFLNGRPREGGVHSGGDLDDDDLLLLFNITEETVPFTLPPAHYAPSWRVGISTVDGFEAGPEAGSVLQLPERSVVVLLGPPRS